jgi:hypothetical protein
MPTKSFKTTLGKGFVELPFDVRHAFGKARPPRENLNQWLQLPVDSLRV